MSLIDLVHACWDKDCGRVSDLISRPRIQKMINTLIDEHETNIFYTARKFTALHVASRHGPCNIVEVLLSHGARTDIRDGSGNYAIHMACESKLEPLEKIKVLIEADQSNLFRKNTHDCTPLLVARSCGRSELADWLQSRLCTTQCIRSPHISPLTSPLTSPLISPISSPITIPRTSPLTCMPVLPKYADVQQTSRMTTSTVTGPHDNQVETSNFNWGFEANEEDAFGNKMPYKVAYSEKTEKVKSQCALNPVTEVRTRKVFKEEKTQLTDGPCSALASMCSNAMTTGMLADKLHDMKCKSPPATSHQLGCPIPSLGASAVSKETITTETTDRLGKRESSTTRVSFSGVSVNEEPACPLASGIITTHCPLASGIITTHCPLDPCKISEAIRYNFDSLKNNCLWKDHMDYLYSRKALELLDLQRIEQAERGDRMRKMLQILLCKENKCWAPLLLESLRETRMSDAVALIEGTCQNYSVSIRPSSAR